MTGPALAEFGTDPAGGTVRRLTIAAGRLSAAFLTRGAILQDLRLAGLDRNLTVGSDDLADYLGPMLYHGALVAPVVNRIANARAGIGGIDLNAPPNAGPHLLHSGDAGAHARIWNLADLGPAHVVFRLDLADMEDGFPGNRRITARYAIEGEATLRLDLAATTDRPTLMNVANHSYWNLDGRPDWSAHRLRVAADAFLPVGQALIPTGEVRDVTGTGHDFRQPRHHVMGQPLIDHCLVLSRQPTALRDVLWFTGSDGTALTMATTEPGIQIYDGGTSERRYQAPAFEAQGWPDAMNHAGFPPVTLLPGQTYATTTTWTLTRKEPAAA